MKEMVRFDTNLTKTGNLLQQEHHLTPFIKFYPKYFDFRRLQQVLLLLALKASLRERK